MSERLQSTTDIPGEIRVGTRAIAAIVARAVRLTKGGGDLAGGAAGLHVQDTPSGLRVEAYVRVRYGAPIEETAAAIREHIGTALTHAIGRPIAEIHVRIQGLIRA